MPIEFPSRGGMLVGTEVKDQWQIVYNTIIEDTYVRVDPRTGGAQARMPRHMSATRRFCVPRPLSAYCTRRAARAFFLSFPKAQTHACA